MSLVNIISNNKPPTHLNSLSQLLQNSDIAIICVAFLKQSGLNQIINSFRNNCTFYIGTDYYLTEPEALKKLIKGGHKVYLTKKAKSTFHPKIYYFKRGKNISILIGSANITGGGFSTNFEASVLLETEMGSAIDKKFQTLTKDYLTNSTLVTNELELSNTKENMKLIKANTKRLIGISKRK